MADDRSHPDLRHDPARRRAVARREHEPWPRRWRWPGALAALGVDVIEAGFPIASQGDFEAVRAIATEVAGATVCGLARCNDRDIDRAWEALQYAQSPRIHVFLATSAIHREHKLKMTREQVIERAVAERPPGQGRTAPTSSSAPRTPRGPRSTSSARSSRPPSTPAPPR